MNTATSTRPMHRFLKVAVVAFAVIVIVAVALVLLLAQSDGGDTKPVEAAADSGTQVTGIVVDLVDRGTGVTKVIDVYTGDAVEPVNVEDIPDAIGLRKGDEIRFEPYWKDLGDGIRTLAARRLEIIG